MELTIAERKYSFRSEYDIEAAGGQYFAQKAAFSFNDKITLQDKSGNSIARINGLFSFLRCKHDFRFFDGRVYHFWLSRFFLPVYVCEGNNESYSLYVHRKLRYSIFRNDVQVAAATKNRVVYGNGSEYRVRANRDADLALLICMIVTLNTADGDDQNDASVTINFGNVGPEARHFDSSWQPT